MKQRDGRDDEIQKMFRAAREADLDAAPSFRAVRASRARGWPRFAVGAGTAVTASGLVVALGATWFLMRGTEAPAIVAEQRFASQELMEAAEPPPATVETVQPAPPRSTAPTESQTEESRMPEPPVAARDATKPAPSPPPPPPITPAKAHEAGPRPVARPTVEPAAPEPPPRAAPAAKVGGTGGVSVVVGDEKGLPLPGAQVTISHATGSIKTTTALADKTGRVEFPVLRSGGGYSIQVSFPGFSSIRYEDLRVRLSQLETLEVNMVEEFQEQVMVVSQLDVIDLDKSETSTRFSDGFIQGLPVPARFYQNVLTMAPGVQDADGDGNPNVHGSRSRDFQAVVGNVSVARSAEEMAFALQTGDPQFNTEGYDEIRENEFLSVSENPLSTFSIDVDTASYANVRRFLEAGQRPPRDAVRIEELLNYFHYDYPAPTGEDPFAVHVEVAECPWNHEHRLARIGLKGREIDRGETAGSNLVFLIDVSGSMQPANKLPLLKSALKLLVKQLDSRDQVAIVVYAGASGLVLPSTPGDQTREILHALGKLRSGGGTNGGAGLRLAYKVARENFIQGGVNRVILATDGDFNLGITTHAELLALIEKDARAGIFLTALGFGMGNYKDGRLELLTARGNGNYAYIDRLAEARKVLVEQMDGTLVTIAKDVKIQVEFNPVEVGAYRLIGYENRMLRKEDFNDDRKDAGEIGAGHTVTALYEIVPPDGTTMTPEVDPLKYQAPATQSDAAEGGELLTVNLRYKEPDEHSSRHLTVSVTDADDSLAAASPDFKFAAAVAEFGLLLRDSAHKGDASLEQVQLLGLEGRDADEGGYRAEFYELVERAKQLTD